MAVACPGLWVGMTHAQISPDVSAEQLRRAQERQSQHRKQQETTSEVRLPALAPSAARQLIREEAPCFPIHNIALAEPIGRTFGWLLSHADGHAQLDSPDPALGRCLGAQGIQTVIDRLQAALLANGYTTTRVLVAAQNLQAGTLSLTVVPGTVGELRLAPGSGQRVPLSNTVPTKAGDLLNLRDLEQALENLKRLPNVEADIQITPGSEPATSDLVFTYRQPSPFRLTATADDSGTRSTGKYQGSLAISYDNILNLSDLFYLTLLHDLGGTDPGRRGTRGHIVHYSLPLGYWLLSGTYSANSYYQSVAGANQDYLYSGAGLNTELKLSRVVQRDAVGKTSVSLKGFQRSSKNFIDDTEVTVQRRVVAGLEWGLNHRSSWSGGSLEANANYRVGTGAWGSLPAPEEAFGEGTSRMRLWLMDTTMQQSFALAGQQWSYSGNWRAQYNKTPLTPQDRLSIGGRYTVRGFDGRSVLSAERGWLLRNELSTPVSQQIRGYIGVDTGHVAGLSAAQLVGQNLSGTVLGLRGQWSRVQYEVFIGKPLSRPEHFKTSAVTAGFSLAMSQ